MRTAEEFAAYWMSGAPPNQEPSPAFVSSVKCRDIEQRLAALTELYKTQSSIGWAEAMLYVRHELETKLAELQDRYP